MKSSLALSVGSAYLLVISTSTVSALTLDELRRDPNLGPETFAKHFSSFKFVFGANVQAPEDFLASKSGDCDDYSTLAASMLAARGYRPRLIAVRMKKMVHVVCYVTEANGYLDYNLRKRGNGIMACGPELADMAEAVAKSFKSKWTSVSEFTFDAGVKRLVKTTLAKETVVSSQQVSSQPARR